MACGASFGPDPDTPRHISQHFHSLEENQATNAQQGLIM